MSDYLTAEQYEYARKTGDWESGKVLTHGQALNENQQLLLEDIQDVASYHEDKNLLGLIWVVGQRIVNKSDIKRFSNDEIMQVLAAFAEWGMKGGNKTSDKKSKKECEYSILEKWLY